MLFLCNKLHLFKPITTLQTDQIIEVEVKYRIPVPVASSFTDTNTPLHLIQRHDGWCIMIPLGTLLLLLAVLL